jgi:hypothetical protein
MTQPHQNYNPAAGDPRAPKNPRFLAAMHAVARGDSPEARQELYGALLESTLLTPLQAPPPGSAPGFVTDVGADRLPFMLMRDMNGRSLFLAFTDSTALLRWEPTFSYVAVPAVELASIALHANADAMVINIAGPTGGEITRPELAVLAQGAIPGLGNTYEFSAATQARVRFPQETPEPAFMSAIGQGLARHPEVLSAHLVDAVVGDGEPHWLLGIRFEEVPEEPAVSEIMSDVVGGVQQFMTPERYMDFMVLRGQDEFTETIENTGLLVYRKII